MADDKPRDDQMIAALKRERATYVARGDDSRVSQVDEQLKHFGYTGEQDAVVDPAGGPAGRTGKEGRQAKATPPPQQTAGDDVKEGGRGGRVRRSDG